MRPKKGILKVSGIQLEMLVERYRRQAADPRRTSFGKQIAEESLAALIELTLFRKNAAVPVRGIVR